MQDITENLIKNYTVYHKIFYVFMVLLTVLSRVMKFTDNTPVCVTFATVVFVFALLDSVFYHMGVFKNMKFLTTFRLIEITTYSIFVSFVPYEGVLLVGMFMILFLLFGVFQFAVHQHTDFLFREKPSCRFPVLDFIFTERVACQPFIVNGNEHHCP